MAPPSKHPTPVKEEQKSGDGRTKPSVKLERYNEPPGSSASSLTVNTTAPQEIPNPGVNVVVNGTYNGNGQVNGNVNVKVKTPPKDIPLFLPPILQQAAKTVSISSKDAEGMRGNSGDDGAKVKRRIIAPGKEEIALRTKPVDERIARKQRRLIRNRVSAQQHRERKKKHVTELEIRVADLTTQNSSLLKKVATLTDSNEELKNQLKSCETKLRRLEDLRFMSESGKETSTKQPPSPVSSPLSTYQLLLPDFDSSYELLDSPNSLDIDWDSSLEEDDDVTAPFDSPKDSLTDSLATVESEDFSDASVSSSIPERPRKQRRRGSSKTLSAACLAALVFTVSVIGDNLRLYPQDNTVYATGPRSLLQASADAIPRGPVVIDTSRRLLADTKASSSQTDRAAASGQKSSTLVSRTSQRKKQQHAILMQLALRESSELLVNRTKNATNELKSAISNELATLAELFKEKPKPAVSNQGSTAEKHSGQPDSKSLVLRTASKETKRLDAVRAALNAFVTHIGGSVRAEDLLQSYIMCPSAYGVLETGRDRSTQSGYRKSRARTQGQEMPQRKRKTEQRKRSQTRNSTDLTLIVPSRSLYGAQQEGIVQLHCQVQRVTEFFVGYK